MKKVYGFLLAVVLVIAMLPMTVQEAEAFTIGSGKFGENKSLSWTLSGEQVLVITGTGSIPDYNSNQREYAPWYSNRGRISSVYIAEGVTGVGNEAFLGCYNLRLASIASTVTRIGNSAFYNCELLQSVSIPRAVTSIGSQAFSGCKKITSLTLPQGITSIGYGTFDMCSSLTGITIPSGVVSIGSRAFAGCWELTEMEIPDSVTSIGSYAFSGCSKLTDVTFGSGLETIGEKAFASCNGLTEVLIPAGVTSIGANAFSSCSALTQIAVDSNNESYSSDAYGLLFDKEQTTILQVPGGFSGEYTIPDSVTNLGDYTFRNCKGLTAVTIGSGVTSVGEEMFYGCSALTSVEMGSNVETIGVRAFYQCSSLTGITFNDRLTSIGEQAFSDCRSLSKLVLPDSLTSIGEHAFSACSALADVTFGSSLDTISMLSFYNCSNLTKVTIPANVTRIVSGAFMDTNLTEITFEGSLPVIEWTALESGNTVTVYYPVYETSWTQQAREDIEDNHMETTFNWATYVPDFYHALEITAQPVGVTVANGAAAKVFVEANGDGLKYQWYYKTATDTSFRMSSQTTAAYSTEMNSVRNGYQVYCVITDKYGSSVQTDTVTLAMITELKITSQPTDVKVASGATASTKVVAVGDGLTYTWYYTDNASDSTFSKSSTTTATYSAQMTSARNGRKVYCVVKDQYGNSVKSNTVTLSMSSGVKITTQPTNVTVAGGATASTKVIATGDGLTYTWYYTDNASDSTFSKSSTTTATYSTEMNSARNGRKVYCVVKDKYGNSVKSNTVTLSMSSGVKITTQPVGVTVANGATAKVTVKATGEGLTYQWYYKSASATGFTKSSQTTATYSTEMNSARNGYKVYCVVKDKNGNSVTSNTVTLSMSSGVKITTQPANVTVASGATAKVSVKATGEGLTYQWYYKSASAAGFTKSSQTTATYSTTMNSARDGYKVYCVVKDQYGNSVTSNTATLTMS